MALRALLPTKPALHKLEPLTMTSPLISFEWEKDGATDQQKDMPCGQGKPAAEYEDFFFLLLK